MQTGTIRRRGNCWMLRYYLPVLDKSGKIVKRPKAKKLATYSAQYHNLDSVRPLADLILAPINAQTSRPESEQTVAAFLEHVFLPHIRESLKPSTQKAYMDFFRLIRLHLGELNLRETRTIHVDKIMKSVADSKPRAHTTLRNVKSFLSGAFRYAKRTDLITENPVRDAVISRGKPKGDTPAYSLEEILAMVNVIPEPAKTAVLLCAFTGLRVSEVKGLRWEDIDGDKLNISRAVWWGKVSDTKNLASRAPVPLVAIVKKALTEHRKRSSGDGYIFQGITGKPLRLENVVRRDIRPALKKAKLEWLGWHAFRRGVATNLFALGVDPKNIQDILRHGDIATTMTHYVKPDAAAAQKAMQKFERAFKKLK